MKRAALSLLVLAAAAAALLYARHEELLPRKEDVRRAWHELQGEPALHADEQRPPAPRPGEPLSVELVEPRATHYADPFWTEADRKYAPLADDVDLVYDPTLGHAARELAAFYAGARSLAPGGLLAFLLDAAGVTAWGVRQSVVVTSGDADEAMRSALERQADGAVTRVGVGEAVLLGKPPRRVVTVLAAGPGPRIEPVAVEQPLDAEITLEGTAPPGFSEVHALVMAPDLSFVEPAVKRDGAEFAVRVPFDASGRWVVELLAEGPRGPAPITQFTFHVDAPAPGVHEGVWPPDEAGLERPDDAADDAAAHLAADRARYGLPALLRDPDLDAIARAHSEDMRDHGFVGHRSPRTGQLDDRLRQAGYRALAHGENVALNNSLWDAQAGLMRSLGHRQNILSREFDRVGFGAAREDDNWYLTQVFALPRPVLDDAASARADLKDRFDALRDELELPALRWNDRLDRAAQTEARRRRPTPRGALDRAQAAGLRASATAWVAIVGRLDDFEPPDALGDSSYRQAGLGLHQAEERDGPDIQLVMLLAR